MVLVLSQNCTLIVFILCKISWFLCLARLAWCYLFTSLLGLFLGILPPKWITILSLPQKDRSWTKPRRMSRKTVKIIPRVWTECVPEKKIYSRPITNIKVNVIKKVLHWRSSKMFVTIADVNAGHSIKMCLNVGGQCQAEHSQCQCPTTKKEWVNRQWSMRSRWMITAFTTW